MLKVLFKLLPVVIFLLGISLSSPFTNQTYAQTCTTPPQVQNVEVEYPSCVGDQCNFTQASCSWTATSGASTYQVTATEVEAGTTVYNQSVPSTTTTVTFSITQNKTYKCDVAAVNSCGTAGPAGTHSLLCAADAAVTVVPTTPPTNPTVPPVGSSTYIMGAGLAIMVIFVGIMVFLI